jgi:hypothetical protein
MRFAALVVPGRGWSAAMSEPSRVSVGGRRLQCQHCGHGGFRPETATLDRVGLGFLMFGGLLWGHHATMYVCVRCGFLHWFFEASGVEHVVEELGEDEGP